MSSKCLTLLVEETIIFDTNFKVFAYHGHVNSKVTKEHGEYINTNVNINHDDTKAHQCRPEYLY